MSRRNPATPPGAVARRPAGQLKRKDGQRASSGFNMDDLMQISNEDVKSELETFQKSRLRLEKANEKLLKELEEVSKKEGEWDDQIQLLESTSRDRYQVLEEKIRKTNFEWERDKKNLSVDLERATTKFDELESEQDEHLDKLDAEFEKELQELREELTSLRKGSEDSASLVEKTRLQLLQAQREREAAVKKAELIKEQTERLSAEVKNKKRDAKVLEDNLNSLVDQEKELMKIEDARSELEAELQRTQKQIKKMEKQATVSKSESGQIADLKRELADWEDKTSTLVEQCSALKTKLKEIGRDQSDAAEDEINSSSFRQGDTSSHEDDASERRAAERQLEELEKDLRRMQKAHEEVKSEYEEKLSEKQLEEQKYETKIKRGEETLKELREELKRVRDSFRNEERERNEKFTASTNQHRQSLRDIEKLRKDLDRQTKVSSDIASSFQSAKSTLAHTLNSLKQHQYFNEKSILTEERISREKVDTQKHLDSIQEQLADTHTRLTEQRSILSTIQLELKQYTQIHEDLITKLEEELYTLTSRTDALVKDRDSRVKEIQRLRWYFRPDTEQAPEKEVDPVAVEKYFERLREERLKDLYSTRDKLKSIRPKDRTLKELQEAFKVGLAALPDSTREDMGYELADLNNAMTTLNMAAKQRFNMFVDFVEAQVDPGIVREVCVLLTIQSGPQGLHPLKTAEHIVNLAKKDSKMNSDLSFRNALLDRLAYERRLRTSKDEEYCRIVILEGGEEWEDSEYQAAYGKNT